MNSQSEQSVPEAPQKKKRLRKRSLDRQMTEALRDAALAGGADISTQKLIQTRLTVLAKMMGRERLDKMKKLTTKLDVVQEENVRLTAELAQARDAGGLQRQPRTVGPVHLADGRSLAESLKEEN